LLLREQRADAPERVEGDDGDREPQWTSDGVRVVGLGAVAVALLVGLYVVSHGHLTPGGGFQGGVLLACGVLLLYLAGELLSGQRVRPSASMELLHAAGAADFVEQAVALGVQRR